MSRARQILLPKFTLSKTCRPGDAGATARSFITRTGERFTYYCSNALLTDEYGCAAPPHSFNLFPVILDTYQIPWRLAECHLIAAIEQSISPPTVVEIIAKKGADLTHFAKFIEQYKIDFLNFLSLKSLRPTYRYLKFLNDEVSLGNLKSSTASRRMGNVVDFYRELMASGLLCPQHEPWTEKRVRVKFPGRGGNFVTFEKETTDVAVKVKKKTAEEKQDKVFDSGLLRPLSVEEQISLFKALRKNSKNVEGVLIHLVMLFTGARIGTALTLRARDFLHPRARTGSEVLIRTGPGTGIDTKNDKTKLLHVPLALYDALQTYANSPRAIKRRQKLTISQDNPYLFVSNRGMPYLMAKQDRSSFNEHSTTQRPLMGDALRTFIKEKILVEMRQDFGPDYSYRSHDLRATAGMNKVRALKKQSENGELTPLEVLNEVAKFLWHDDIRDTQRYLDFDSIREGNDVVQRDYEEYQLKLWQMTGYGT